MPNLDLPIMVVDDAKFSSTLIGKNLKTAGYRDIRFANNAPKALEMMEERPVRLLIADWLMPEMDGLELATRVRQQDEQLNQYTYIILLTGKESVEALANAFDQGVDDFIYKSDMTKQLLPRVYAADRITDLHNGVLVANQFLMESNQELQSKNTIDLETGLGNQRYAREKLVSDLRQTEFRGGATSYLLIGLQDWQGIKNSFGHAIAEEIAIGVARRLRHLVRPLDAVCRISENQYVVVSHFADIEHCTVNCYRRIHDGISIKAFKTTKGFVTVAAGTAVIATAHRPQMPQPQDIERKALKMLQHAFDTSTITIETWNQSGEVTTNEF